mmetsp:Transcript_124127/g.345515  ORF Transcript_124127/g.345515 Transcript_124127/m.345515 type:complete len:259 (-) Transcript_124127:123-899(-)
MPSMARALVHDQRVHVVHVGAVLLPALLQPCAYPRLISAGKCPALHQLLQGVVAVLVAIENQVSQLLDGVCAQQTADDIADDIGIYHTTQELWNGRFVEAVANLLIELSEPLIRGLRTMLQPSQHLREAAELGVQLAGAAEVRLLQALAAGSQVPQGLSQLRPQLPDLCALIAVALHGRCCADSESSEVERLLPLQPTDLPCGEAQEGGHGAELLLHPYHVATPCGCPACEVLERLHQGLVAPLNRDTQEVLVGGSLV